MKAIDNRLRSILVINSLIFVFFAGILWIAHFWNIDNFGLYEDDYVFVGTPVSTDLNGLIELIKNVWIRFEQGRPLGFSCSYILSFIGFHLAGMKGVYFCGYTIILINTLLFYWLMWRLSHNRRLAIIAGLAFGLFPADTTATFLTHSLGLYCCITFFLLATHSYISNYRWLSYLAITASLISYETCLLLFLSVPLLTKRTNLNLKKELITNGIIIFLLLSMTIIVRKLVGESRIVELNPVNAIGTSISHTLIGPFVSLGMYLYRPIYTIFNWRLELFLLVPIAFFAILLLLRKILLTESNHPSYDLTDRIIAKSKLWIVGTIMLFSAYPLTIILRSGDINGRASRVHLAAIIGGSILCALGVDRLLSIAETNTQKRLGLIGVSTMFALLVGFGVVVQSDYQLAWQKQQDLVASVTKLCPDMKEGTTIFVEQKDLHNPIQIAAYSWSMPLLLETIYIFPPQWQVIPRIYPIYGNWQEQIDNSDRLPLSKITEWLTFIPKQHQEVVKTQDVIMLKLIDEKFTRLDRLSLKNGVVLNFKPREPQSKINFRTRPLYPYLISPSKS